MLIERDDIINHTIDRFEGGAKYTNRKSDRGGATKFGITKRTLQSYLTKAVTDKDVQNLTRETAVKIYTEVYWNDVSCNKLPECLRCLVFDMAVNHGAGNAGRILQWGLKNMQCFAPRPDGLIGPYTLTWARAAVEKYGAKAVLTEIVTQRKDFYENIIHLDPAQVVNHDGWINRANWFLSNMELLIPKEVDKKPPPVETKNRPGFFARLFTKQKGESK